MNEKGEAARAVARNLHAAIERVREDVEKIEFWAEAVAGFSQPVPDYKSSDVKVWVPQEQARSIDAHSREKTPKARRDSKRT